MVATTTSARVGDFSPWSRWACAMDTQRRSSVATFMAGANFAKYSATMARCCGYGPAVLDEMAHIAGVGPLGGFRAGRGDVASHGASRRLLCRFGCGAGGGFFA